MSTQNARRDPGSDIADRRSSDRFHIKGAKVEYLKVEFLSFIDKNMKRQDDLMNVSEGGMLFASGEDFAAGQNLSLILHVPHRPETPKMRGEVVRCAPSEGSDGYQVGVKFTMFCSDAADMLQSLAQQCKEHPGQVKLYISNGRRA